MENGAARARRSSRVNGASPGGSSSARPRAWPMAWDRVAVLMDNSLEMVVLLFGILRYGAVAVPLNVSVSDSAVARMIEDADARAIFASHRHCRRIEELHAQSETVARAVRVAL